ncbi:MAG: LPS assembly lipoprotein LptE [Rudaea sp.]
MKLLRFPAIFAVVLTLAACGFQLRGEANLSADLHRVHVSVSDPFSPLGRDVAAALTRAGASVADAPGDGIAEIDLANVSLSPVVRSVGANALVNEFSMVYHVELSIQTSAGKSLLATQVIEHTRDYTFDQTQAIGSNAEQDEIKKGMERDMVQAVMRKIEAVGHDD